MVILARIWHFLFPRRASTQTWMILTFALFVGIAVALVGLYTVLILRGDLREAARETLLEQTLHVAEVIERAETEAERERLVHEFSRITGYGVTLFRNGELLLEVNGHLDNEEDPDRTLADVRQAQAQGFAFSQRRDAEGRHTLYAAVYNPGTGHTVRLGQLAPPSFEVVQRMQLTLLIGMVLALLFAIVGSWIAAHQVTQPLRAITRSARRINEGYLDEKIRVDSRAAEFQDLSESLNLMAERFRTDIHDLQRVAQVQNEFIGNVSHEVKNPIFAVSGYLEALGSPNLTEELRQRYSQKGLANLQRLNNLFTDLIEIARLEYREDLIEPGVFDLAQLVDEVAESVMPKARPKGLALETDNDPIEVYADKNRIRQVLTNLIENAINYTDEGVVRCRLRRHRNKARVEVVDTGRGIGEEHLDRVFERFYRVDTARSRKQGGTGLGLSIVKQILHAHGETIHVESTLGRGSRFWFELPWAGAVSQKQPSSMEEHLDA